MCKHSQYSGIVDHRNFKVQRQGGLMWHSVDTDSHKNEVTVARGGDGWADRRNCNVVQEVTDPFMNCKRKVN